MYECHLRIVSGTVLNQNILRNIKDRYREPKGNKLF